MRPSHHTRESIVEAIRLTAQKLGHVPTSPELRAFTGITQGVLLGRFPSLAAAIHEAGFKPRACAVRIPQPVLLEAWGGMARELGRPPRFIEYMRRGKFSVAPFLKRFKQWSAIPAAFLQQFGEQAEWADVCQMVRNFPLRAKPPSAPASEPEPDPAPLVPAPRPKAKRLSDRPAYGKLLDFRGMRNEPVGESGVIFLFGAVAEDLGFQVEMIQTGFPDCEALRDIGEGKWQRVRIEFEFESRNFRKVGHPIKGCDLIVCWRHNWPDCPLAVLELSTEINSFPK